MENRNVTGKPMECVSIVLLQEIGPPGATVLVPQREIGKRSTTVLVP